MDLKSYKRSDTATIDILDPLGNKTDVKVEVYGADSKHYRESRVKVARRYEDYESATKEEKGAALLQACIASWENVELEGKKIKPDSEDAFKMLMDEELGWFTSQISAAIFDRSKHFTKPDES